MSAGFDIQPEAFAFEAEPSELEAWQAEAPGGWQQEQNRGSADYIRWVQSALNQVLGLNLAVDGRMGPQTRSAVRSFQQKQGLIVDGVIGPATEAALTKAMGGAGTAPVITFRPDTIKPADARLKGFDKNSAKLKSGHDSDIDRVADKVAASWKTGRPIFTIYVKGHTSSEGSAQYNIGLGNRRALTVRKALQKALERKQKNLSYKVLVLAQSKGAKEPIDSNQTEEGRSNNRRVEVFLSTKALAPIRPKPPLKEPTVTTGPTGTGPDVVTPRERVCNSDILRRELDICEDRLKACNKKCETAISYQLEQIGRVVGLLGCFGLGNPALVTACALVTGGTAGKALIDEYFRLQNCAESCKVMLDVCQHGARLKSWCLKPGDIK
jgi:outer membrane protein OmpA-like peptidoglycan-associated protein